MKGKKVKMFSAKMIGELSEPKDFGYAGGKYLVWKEELMDKHHENILKIIHQKLYGKIMVFHGDIIDLNGRVTTYGIIRKVDWNKKYKTCFHVQYARICLSKDDIPCVRLMEDGTTFVSPTSCYEVLTKEQFDTLLASTVSKINAKFFKK